MAGRWRYQFARVFLCSIVYSDSTYYYESDYVYESEGTFFNDYCFDYNFR